jgi:glycosyltransferase involved in cell wall biosynthesis
LTRTDLISVIVPVHNGARFLVEAVSSIRRQDYRPLEIVIVDDGSSDETARLAAALTGGGSNDVDTRYLHQENRGPAAARNRGLAAARGDLIAFLDVDDLWPAGKLASQHARLRAEPGLDILLSRLQVVTLPGAASAPTPPRAAPLRNIHLGGGLFRRAAFDRVGPFDESLRFSEDHDWFLRAREQGLAIAISDQVGLYYRRHDENLTADQAGAARGFQLAEVLKRSLDRRRQQNHGRAPSLPEIPDVRDR